MDDPPNFNRNANLPKLRQELGITKHLVLVINPDRPPEREQLLNSIFAFANHPAKTGSINVWAPSSEVQQTQTPSQTSRGLWRKYNQDVATISQIQRQVAIAGKALQDGFAAMLPDILACDPFVKKINREQGPQKARNHIQLIIRTATIKREAPQQPQPSRQEAPRRDKAKGPQL